MFLRRISVEGKAIEGGGLGKSRWWKFNLLFKLCGDDGECECNELSETSMSEASSTSKLLSTCSGDPACWSYSGVVDRSRLFLDRFKTGLSLAGEGFWELRCFSLSCWFSSSFSFLNLDETRRRKERKAFNDKGLRKIMQRACFLPFQILYEALVRRTACLP